MHCVNKIKILWFMLKHGTPIKEVKPAETTLALRNHPKPCTLFLKLSQNKLKPHFQEHYKGSLICTRMTAYQRVRNVSFSENFTHVLKMTPKCCGTCYTQFTTKI